MAANITPAVLFRTVEMYRPTILVDEFDTQAGRSTELRNLLNAGYGSRGRVLRADGPSRKPRAFSVFCPKAVAGIGELPSTLEDRSIVVEMNRRGADDRSVDDVKYGDIFEDLTPLRRKLLRWSGDHREALTGAGPEEPEALNARERDHWRLLFAIADLCSPSWGERIRAAAVTLSSRRRQPDVGTLLLEDIRRIIMDLNGWKQIPSSELAYTLAGIEDRPWYEWGGPKGFNPHQLAILLHPYNIKPKALYRQGQSDVVRGYLFTDFLEAFDRYLPKLPVLQRSALPEHPDAVKINLSFTKS